LNEIIIHPTALVLKSTAVQLVRNLFLTFCLKALYDFIAIYYSNNGLSRNNLVS